MGIPRLLLSLASLSKFPLYFSPCLMKCIFCAEIAFPALFYLLICLLRYGLRRINSTTQNNRQLCCDTGTANWAGHFIPTGASSALAQLCSPLLSWPQFFPLGKLIKPRASERLSRWCPAFLEVLGLKIAQQVLPRFRSHFATRFCHEGKVLWHRTLQIVNH